MSDAPASMASTSTWWTYFTTGASATALSDTLESAGSTGGAISASSAVARSASPPLAPQRAIASSRRSAATSTGSASMPVRNLISSSAPRLAGSAMATKSRSPRFASGRARSRRAISWSASPSGTQARSNADRSNSGRPNSVALARRASFFASTDVARRVCAGWCIGTVDWLANTLSLRLAVEGDCVAAESARKWAISYTAVGNSPDFL